MNLLNAPTINDSPGVLMAIDPPAILSALGFHDPMDIAPASGGRDTAIFRVWMRARAYALRVFHPDQFAMSQTEVRAMSNARSEGIPATEVVAHGVANDLLAMLLSWCTGRLLVAELMEHPERAQHLGAAAGDALARINGIEVPTES